MILRALTVAAGVGIVGTATAFVQPGGLRVVRPAAHKLPARDAVFLSPARAVARTGVASLHAQMGIKAPPDMYQNAVDVGEKKAKAPATKTFLMGIISGCHIAFGALLALTVGGNCPGIAAANPGLQKIIFGSFGLPFGLFMTVVGGGELFTGNTAMVTAARVEGKASNSGLLRNWASSYAGNFVGSLLIVYLVKQAGIVANPATAAGIAVAKSSLTFAQAFTRGIMCNWLVCMAVWMSASASDAFGKFCAIFLPISAFVAMGLDHSVANMFLIPMGMALGAGVSWGQFLAGNLIPVTLGNIVGGALAVCGLYAGSFSSRFKKA